MKAQNLSLMLKKIKDNGGKILDIIFTAKEIIIIYSLNGKKKSKVIKLKMNQKKK
jgi:hypothetical protein